MSTVSVGVDWSKKGRKPAKGDAKAQKSTTAQRRTPNDKPTGSRGGR